MSNVEMRPLNVLEKGSDYPYNCTKGPESKDDIFKLKEENMFRKQSLKMWLAFIPAAVIIGILAGCAAKTASPWGDPETGLILQYRMTEDQVLKYQTSAEQTQDIEVMGQAVSTETTSSSAFTVKSKGLKENNHLLHITIDSMSIDISSPQGDISPDLNAVIGKSFEMVLSPLGKELDVSDAASIQYDLGVGGSRSVESSFQTVFPDLADRPVKIGDIWPGTDTITEKTSVGEVLLSFESVNTLEGFETVDGMECIKVTAKLTGTLDGKGEQMGVEMSFKGDIQGTETWYFAYKEGIFVKGIMTAHTRATITTSGIQAMTIPLEQETRMETKLVK